MTPQTVDEVLDAAATRLAQPDTEWRRYGTRGSWRHTVPAAIALVLHPTSRDADPTQLAGNRERATLAHNAADFLAHYLIDYVGDVACWDPDTDELDIVETILQWETEPVLGVWPGQTEVCTVLLAAAAEYRERAAARTERVAAL